MDALGKDKYKVVKNFLSKEQLVLLQNYCFLTHKLNFDNFDQQQHLDTGIYSDKVMEALMVSKQKIVENLCGVELFPTYSYWRMYTYESQLKMHSDRPSCEYSATVMIGSDGTPWDFIAGNKSYIQEPGDAIIYKGCELPHGRPESFKGDWHAQVFLHYVDQKGDNKDYIFDKRICLGLPK